MVVPEFKKAQPQLPVAGKPFHRWTLPDDTLWTTFHRTEGGFLLRFPGFADFCVSYDGQKVNCVPTPGTSQATTEHLYLNQVLPLALSRCGKLVFHASAVEVQGGAIAFPAPAGRGKSTLCAAFAISGHRFLTDDGLLLEPNQTRFDIIPSHASIRLWQDSQEHLFANLPEQILPTGYSSKARFLAGGQLDHCDQARPLLATFFLGDGRAAEITLRRLSEAETFIEWTKHSFLLDIQDEAEIGAHFHKVADLSAQIPCYHLNYPRDYQVLPEVLSSLLDLVTKLGSANEYASNIQDTVSGRCSRDGPRNRDSAP
ncbi:MAG: hypothetical protein AB7V13_13055 [Pseudorhodoplanes sp.]